MCIETKFKKNIFNTIKFVTTKKHLGFIINDHLSDDDDIERQMRCFYISSNMLMRQFSRCTYEVKCVLFKTYCYQLYGGPMWAKYSSTVLRKLKVAFNNAARLLLGYEKRSSASSMFVSNRIDTFDALLRRQIYGFKTRILKSKNFIVQTVYEAVYFNSETVKLWNKLLYV